MREIGAGGSRVWGDWVKDRRKAKQMTRRALAIAADLDPSYITLMERDSYIPKRHVCARIGRVLADEETGMIMGGFIDLGRRRKLVHLPAHAEIDKLPEHLRILVRKLAKAPARVQEQAAAVLTVLVSN